MPRPPSVRDPELIAAAKDQTVLLGRIQRHVERRGGVDEDRATDVLHPSALSHSDFCPRATWHQMSGYPMLNPPKPFPFVLLSIFNEGSAIHGKWQSWLWDMGELIGEFLCLVCETTWWDQAPSTCTACGAGRKLLEYREVPAEDPELRIAGRADSRVGNTLQEYKTVGEGTVRIEHPRLYEEHSYRLDHPRWRNEFVWVDLKGLWRGITMPFPSHLRQIQLYLHLTGLDSAQVIYECKWNQQSKEFNVRYRPTIVEPMLDLARDVVWGLESGRAPSCPHGGIDECAQCQIYEGRATDAALPGREPAAWGEDTRGEGRDREVGLPASRPASDRATEAADEPDRAVGRPADGAVRDPGPMARPHRRVVGAP